MHDQEKHEKALQKANELMDEAYEAQENCNFKKVKKIGKKLIGMKYSGGYEIVAKSLYEEDKLEKAIKILEEGLSAAPRVWPLWLQLGNYRSDLRNFKGAHDAYKAALDCPGVDASSIHLNMAIALSREGSYLDALTQVSFVTGEEHKIRAMELKAGLLTDVGRYDEARQLAEETIRLIGDSDQYQREHSELHVVLARALMAGESDKEEALKHTREALHIDRTNKNALYWLRQLTGVISGKNKYYGLLIHGRWNAPFEGEEELPGFFTDYELVAESQEEALEIVKDFEMPEIRDSLKIEKIKKIENSPDQPKGIYKVYGRVFYHKKNE